MSIRYAAGDWFALPLEGGGYGLGLVARDRPGRRILLAYFFGPRQRRIPTIDDTKDLQHPDAVDVQMVGDLGLISGTWPVLGRHRDWDAKAWPMPAFGRSPALGGPSLRVVYSEDDLNVVLSETRISPAEAASLPPDGLLGAEAAQRRIGRLLATDLRC